MQFEELNLSPEVLNGLRDFNYKEPTPIQEQCIPKILEGKDIIASAQTGTGKTGAFVLPILTKVQHKGQGIRALILSPTRELAKQIDEQIVGLGYYTGVTSATVYGGGGSDDWTRQEKTLYAEQVNIIVATPGRLIDHMTIREINFNNIDFFVLDEADRMLDMGFLGDVRTIESRMPRKRQNLLFSATIPDDIEKFAREITHHPDRINVATRTEAKGVRQIVYKAPEKYKMDLLVHLAKDLKMDSTIVFVRTKKGTESLARSLSRAGLKVTSIHGDRTQKEREEALNDFRSGKYNIVVATDVLSRGIDIADVSHIVNYDVPSELDDYIHRIGRTARADAKGDAITFVCKRDERKFQIIEKTMKNKLDFRELPDASWNGDGNGERENNKRDKSSDSDKSSGKSSRKSGSRSNRKPSRSKGGDRSSSKNVKTKTAGQDSSDNEKKTDQKPTSKRRSSGSQNRGNSSRKRQGNRGRSSAKSTGEESGSKTNNRSSRRPQNSRKNTRGPRRKTSDGDTAVNYEDVRKQQRQSLRDAQSTKRALMQNKEYSGPEKKGIVGFIKKIFGKDD